MIAYVYLVEYPWNIRFFGSKDYGGLPLNVAPYVPGIRLWAVRMVPAKVQVYYTSQFRRRIMTFRMGYKIITEESKTVNWLYEALSQPKSNVVLQFLDEQNYDERSVNIREDTRYAQGFSCLDLGPLWDLLS